MTVWPYLAISPPLPLIFFITKFITGFYVLQIMYFPMYYLSWELKNIFSLKPDLHDTIKCGNLIFFIQIKSRFLYLFNDVYISTGINNITKIREDCITDKFYNQFIFKFLYYKDLKLVFFRLKVLLFSMYYLVPEIVKLLHKKIFWAIS